MFKKKGRKREIIIIIIIKTFPGVIHKGHILTLTQISENNPYIYEIQRVYYKRRA